MFAVRVSAVLLLTFAATAAENSTTFRKDILPVFESSCWKCHGGSVQLAKLDLRSREAMLKGGEKGTVVVPGKAANSKLYRMVAGLEKPAMPLDGKLKPEQVEAFRAWIDAGAPWDHEAVLSSKPPNANGPSEDMVIPAEARKYWAFQVPKRAAVPPSDLPNPIDAFLDQARRNKNLSHAPKADRRDLIRRAYLDLTGLPPTPAQTDAFANDNAPDAWPKLIDRLLESPHYGERWGRHWLDVARYADSNGFEHDFDRPNAWRYRDYVIRSLNADKPYDQFLREQLAGDELEHVTRDSLIATGFLRNHAKVGFREKDNPEFRYEYLDDMIATIGRGVLGLTVQCARCHNHKFDPIPQKDYYRLQASLWGAVEVDHPLVPKAQADEYYRRKAEIDTRVKELENGIREIEQPYRAALLPAKYKRFPRNVQDAINKPEEQRTPGEVLLANQVIRTVGVPAAELDQAMSAADLQRRKQLREQIEEVNRSRPEPIPVAMGITDGDYRFTPDGPGDEPAPGKGKKSDVTEGSYLHTGTGKYVPPPSYFLIRGDVNSQGSLMKPGFVTVATFGNPPVELPPDNGHTSGRRLALADWLVSKDNPLPSRVLVNRVWHLHFGRGLVRTLDNFGKMGEAPSHPELLDFLATEFQANGWSLKRLHRLMMTSEAYQMSSRYTDAAATSADPDNRLLWKFNMQRMDAETVRDSILFVSGGLNREMFGKPVFPELPAEVLESMKYGIWRKEDDGPGVWRRSVYVYRKRGLPFPLFETFDLPDQNIACGARNITTVPTQALMLMNNEFVLKQAELFANRVREAAPDDSAKQVDLAFRLALGRPPTGEEQRIGAEYLSRRKLVDLTHVLLNTNEFLYVR